MATSKLKHKRPQKVLAWGVLLHLLAFTPNGTKYWMTLVLKPILSNLANTETENKKTWHS